MEDEELQTIVNEDDMTEILQEGWAENADKN